MNTILLFKFLFSISLIINFCCLIVISVKTDAINYLKTFKNSYENLKQEYQIQKNEYKFIIESTCNYVLKQQLIIKELLKNNK